MIRIQLNDKIIKYHRDYIIYDSGIEDKLGCLKTEYNGSLPDFSNFIDYLLEHVSKLKGEKYNESIFVMTPEKISKEIEFIKNNHRTAYNECMKGDESENSLTTKLIDALGYERFCNKYPYKAPHAPKKDRPDKHPDNWCAYTFVKEIDLSVCPYCNRTFIHTVYSDKDSSKTRADLDHFLPKSLYPYFSLSIYNLIPTCKVCNSSLKGSKNFDYKKYMNPYEEIMEKDLMHFSYAPDNFKSAVGLDSKDLEVILNYNSAEKQYKRLKNNCDIFAIDALYQNHTDIVSNILKKHYIFNNEYKENLQKTYPDLFSSSLEVDKLLFDIVDKEEIRNSILGKLKYDIKKQLDSEIYT